MYTKSDLHSHLHTLGIDPQGTLLVHSSYKSIGTVDGGAEAILDVFIDYMRQGLLVFPSHTWGYINAENPRFHVADSPSNVGILSELFRRRPETVRSWHPTHSVCALGADAEAFTAGDERWDTPCARGSAWGRLLDRKAQIMLLGVDLRRNTFIHGVEEWADIPGRLGGVPENLITVTPDGREIAVPSYRHSGLSWSHHYWKVDGLLEREGAMTKGRFGDAEVRVCDAFRTNEVLGGLLRVNPALFSDNEPLDGEEQPAPMPKTRYGKPEYKPFAD